jgi:hypothetical protein
MPTIPCPNISPCTLVTPPYLNISAEAPDRDVFIGLNFGNPQLDPPLGSVWTQWGCLGECVSYVSQAEADQCAANQQVQCTVDGGPGGFGGPGGGGGGGGGKPPGDESTIGGNPPINPQTGEPYDTFKSDPQNCSVSCPDGTLSNFSLPAGYAVGLSKAHANAIAHSACVIGANRNRVCIGEFAGFSCSGSFYSQQLSATGGNPPFTFAVTSGVLPDGLTMDAAGLITGVPSTPGNFTFTVQATNIIGSTASKAMTFEVLGITNPGVLPNATQGTAYTYQMTSGSGADTFAVTAGTLPAGLTMDKFGLITGTPTTPGATTFEVTVTDVFENQCKEDFVIEVNPPVGVCPWPNLVWGPIVNLCSPVDVSGALSGGIFSMSGAGGAGPCGDVGGPAEGHSDGSISYNGPALICNLHVVGNFADTCNSGVGVTQDGNPVLSVGIGVGVGALPAGTYDFPFTLADTGGIPSSIIVSVGLLAGAFLGNSGSGSISGTLTCGCPVYGVGTTPAVPATWSFPQPGQVRIQSYDPSLFGPCAGCSAAGFPAWDGTLPVQFAPNNFVNQYNPAGTDIGMGTFPQFTINGKGTAANSTGIACVFDGGFYWELYIKCADGVVIWEGTKFYGLDPTGVYVRRPFITQYSTGPQCLTIESY